MKSSLDAFLIFFLSNLIHSFTHPHDICSLQTVLLFLVLRSIFCSSVYGELSWFGEMRVLYSYTGKYSAIKIIGIDVQPVLRDNQNII